ncbi:MAG: transglutaminaseTgpA domain-containing protein [Chloroflexi bacterium]|nr:transglutaminaseTgpA domain-containing protein [Chloroflexota bacterium]
MTTNTATLPTSTEPAAAATYQERLQRGGGWLTFALVLVMLAAMAQSLIEAGWSEGLMAVQAAALAGVILGFLLALTRWEGVFPAFYSFLASIPVIVALLQAAMLDTLNVHDAMQEIFRRNVLWFTALFSGSPAADNLIFVMQLCLLGWWIGYLAVWSLVRHQRVIHAVIPAGVGLLVNAYYAPMNLGGYVALYLLAVVLIAMRVELARNEARWQLAQMRYAPDILLDFLKAGVIFAIAITAAAWVIPDVTDYVATERLLQPFDEPWKKVEETWSRMYRALQYRGNVVQSTPFGKSMALGGPVTLTDRPIFEAVTPVRTYWRASAFDTYTGQGWLNTDSDVATLERNQALPELPFGSYVEITVTIRPQEPRQDVIFAPPQPLRVNLPLKADVARPTGEKSLGVVSLLHSRLTLTPKDTYLVVSGVSDASPDQLRADRSDHGEWIAGRYLQLPDTLPVRVRTLASQLTQQYNNPYDKAAAIEQYLRRFTYNQKIAAPPAGSDGVDYFLFGVKQGYCDYYASAMAVMLRSIGIPARFVTGYTPGTRPESTTPGATPPNTYRVLEQNSHAWVEVYFPSYGWIQFEPTASEPQMVRPEPKPAVTPTPQLTRLPDATEEPDDLLSDRGRRSGPLDFTPTSPLIRWVRDHVLALALGLAAAALIGGAWAWTRRQRKVFFSDTNLVMRLFDLLGTWAGRLRIPWLASSTPLERAAAFNAALPEAGAPVDRLTGRFVAQQYGRQQPSGETLTETATEWDGLQPVLWRGWLRWLVKQRPRMPWVKREPTRDFRRL